MAGGYRVTGALLDAGSINRTAVVGKHDGKLFIVAFHELRSNAFGGIGENRIRGFKSADDGATWEQVGSSLRSADGWLDACVDGRGDASPYIYITYFDIHFNHVIARFNMATEAFDLESHFLSGPALLSKCYIACNSHGEVRLAIADGGVTELPDHTYRHEITPYTVAFSGGTLSGGGNVPVPGIVYPHGAFVFMGIAPAPAAGAHPEGAEGWRYILSEQYFDGATVRNKTVMFDDSGVKTAFLDDNDARCRTGVRTRFSASEPFILTYQAGTSNYWSELITNDPGGISVRCSQGQVPTVTIQGGGPYTGGGVAVGRGTDAYLMWFTGASLKATKAVGSLALCGGWGAFETLLTVDEAPVFMHGANSINDGIAVTYAVNDVSPSDLDQHFDVWYVLYPLGGGCPQPEVSTHECEGVPDTNTESSCGRDLQGYAE